MVDVPRYKMRFPLLSCEEEEELDQAAAAAAAAAEEEELPSKKRMLLKQLSMKDTTLEAKWEKRKQQILSRRRRRRKAMSHGGCEEEVRGAADAEEEERKARARVRSLTDEDLEELRGSIELGFGFNEEDGGHSLRDTLPALDLYFAVNRQLSDPKLQYPPSPVGTATATSSSSNLCSTPSPRSPREEHDSWKICSPGDRPQDVKVRLRQWAQIVACSVRQCRQYC